MPTESDSACDLQGVGVLVTRAAHQAEPLCRAIEAHGGRVVRFPALAVEPAGGTAELRASLAVLQQGALLVFVSPNAVEYGLKLLPRDKPAVQLAAVGRATAKALEQAGWPVDILPQSGFDSEGLLASEALQQVAGRQVLIFRGEGGRALLGDTLIERGAQLSYVEVYRRVCPQLDVGPLLQRWPTEVQLVTATSNAVLENLLQMLGPAAQPMLLATPLLVISRRMRERAQQLGFRRILLAQGADEQSIMERLCSWMAQSNHWQSTIDDG
ncbi:uroporphyrinogen-III synthase [Candidatus Endoriftia persephonae]|jgi:uroporphyrinogen-III synthase|uniref:Uroporphyrinogen-III synthase n=1 Tax=Candidatus Endoriftia persephonae TaxID=393765 RepID=A0A9J6ZXJ9_9GAMM|nr:uroporphyrinogen-III synthase [Candidatus Endoriftia persephone]USF87571.1 uroporphyrinogen-III synthase [Candidatus Endoriftia persephone]